MPKPPPRIKPGKKKANPLKAAKIVSCLLYTSPSPRD